MTKILASILLTLAMGCDRHAPEPTYAEVDCSRMTDHMIEVLVKDGAATQTEAARVRQKMIAQRDALVAGCLKDRPVRRLTQSQYACLLSADSADAMSRCQ